MDESGGTTVYSPALWTRAKEKEIGEKLHGRARKAEVFCRSFSYMKGANGPNDAFGENDRSHTGDDFMKVSRSCALLLDCISARFCRTLAILAKNFGGLCKGAELHFANRADAGTVQLQTVTDVVSLAKFQVWKVGSNVSSRKFTADGAVLSYGTFPCCRFQTPGSARRSSFLGIDVALKGLTRFRRQAGPPASRDELTRCGSTTTACRTPP